VGERWKSVIGEEKGMIGKEMGEDERGIDKREQNTKGESEESEVRVQTNVLLVAVIAGTCY